MTAYDPRPAFLITSYKQVELVVRNIRRIRTEYPADLARAPIIVVSTSEEPVFEERLRDQSNVHFVPFRDAPGAKGARLQLPPERMSRHDGWRAQYLPARILLSIQRGLKVAAGLDCRTCLHLHSDTYWLPAKADRLLFEMELLEHKLFIGDVSYPNEKSFAQTFGAPRPRIHFQPEGLHFNLRWCQRVGFGFNFEKIWEADSAFRSHDFGAIEALIGQFAVFCLTGANCLPNDTEARNTADDAIHVRTTRVYHGVFRSGLVNLNLPPDKVASFSEEDIQPRRYGGWKTRLLSLLHPSVEY